MGKVLSEDLVMKNYQLIKNQILTHLLSGVHPPAVSKQLGYGFNKVGRWLNGTKQLKWDEFCSLCEVLNIDLKLMFERSHGYIFAPDEKLTSVISILRSQNSNQTVVMLSEALGVSTSNFNKYMAEKIYPDIEFVLAFIDLRKDCLSLFVDNIMGTQKVLSNNAFLKNPWNSAVSACFFLENYKNLPVHSSDWIAKFIGITEENVDQSIKTLLEANIIFYNGTHYESSDNSTETVGGISNGAQLSALTYFWTKRAGERYENFENKPINNSLTPSSCIHRIFPCSEKAGLVVREILFRAYNEIHEFLIQDTEPRIDVRAIVLHHFSSQDYEGYTKIQDESVFPAIYGKSAVSEIFADN